MIDAVASNPRELLTVAQFASRHHAFSQPSLRNLILNADDRLSSRKQIIKGNGLAKSGAIVRIGRRVLIDEAAFFIWIAQQQPERNPASGIAL